MKLLHPTPYTLSPVSGQSLIEILVAISIVSLVVLSMIRATTSSVRNTTYSKEENKASTLAQKKIAEIVASKNNNPRSFFSSLPTYPDVTVENSFCLKTVLTSKTADLPTTTPNYSEAEMVQISINVYWGEKPDACTVNCDCDSKKYSSIQNYTTNITN